MLQGKVVPSPDHLLEKNGYICLIITEVKATQEMELLYESKKIWVLSVSMYI